MFEGKRGQGLQLSTLILIVLGVIILVLLVWGFSIGWSNFWDRINIFGTSNVDRTIDKCKAFCTTNQEYNFCNEELTVKFGKKIEVTLGDETLPDVKKVITTCGDLAKDGSAKLEGGENVIVNGIDIKIEPCSAFSC